MAPIFLHFLGRRQHDDSIFLAPFLTVFFFFWASSNMVQDKSFPVSSSAAFEGCFFQGGEERESKQAIFDI